MKSEFFECDPETKWQRTKWLTLVSPCLKRAWVSKPYVKAMLISFFDIKCVVHHEFVFLGQIVMVLSMWKCWKEWREEWTKWGQTLVQTASWKLHHNNSPSCFVIHDYLALNGITILLQSPFYSDLALVDFSCFSKWRQCSETLPRGCSRSPWDLDAMFEGHFRKGFLGHLLSIDNSLTEVCWCLKELFWKILIVCIGIINILPRSQIWSYSR